MIGFIKKLFGSSKNVETLVETGAKGLYNGIDKVFYTDEEKAETLTMRMNLFQDFVKVAYDQNSIRSITRRWLAFMVVGPTMTFYVGAAIFQGLGSMLMDVDPETGINAAISYGSFLFAMGNTLIPWAGGILAFYFGSQLMGMMKGKQE